MHRSGVDDEIDGHFLSDVTDQARNLEVDFFVFVVCGWYPIVTCYNDQVEIAPWGSEAFCLAAKKDDFLWIDAF